MRSSRPPLRRTRRERRRDEVAFARVHMFLVGCLCAGLSVVAFVSATRGAGVLAWVVACALALGGLWMAGTAVFAGDRALDDWGGGSGGFGALLIEIPVLLVTAAVAWIGRRFRRTRR